VWYFSAILGLGLVSFFAILNAMWVELDYDDHAGNDPGGAPDVEDPGPDGA
jgi:cyd operon protein YbgT